MKKKSPIELNFWKWIMSFFLLSLSSKKGTVGWGYLLSFFINHLNPFNKNQKVKGLTFITCMKATSLGFNFLIWKMTK